MAHRDEPTAGAARHQSFLRPIGAAVVTTAGVTALSYALPPEHAATAVGLAFLVATYSLALRNDPDDAHRFGLSLGGLLDPYPLEGKRLLRDATRALGWIAAMAALTFPAYWVGYVLWWTPDQGFALPSPVGNFNEALGQVLVIALPEEAFYRGYLQTALDEAWPPRRRLLGAPMGLGVIVTSALFAVGHVATEPYPSRLAVFFPALLFGWLRSRTGGIGASMGYHALCNLFASFLARGYGLMP